VKVVEAISSVAVIPLCFHSSAAIAVSYLFSLIVAFLSTSKLIILVELTVNVKPFHRCKIQIKE